MFFFFFFSSRRRHTILTCDWSSDVCSSDLRVGEGIGFFKCGPGAGRELMGLLEQVIDDSQGICEYEDALHLLVSRQHVEAVSVTGLPWTEVDFAEDLHRAQSEVFPAIDKLEGA